MISKALPLLADEEANASSAAVLSGWVSQGSQVDFATLSVQRLPAPHPRKVPW
ncbi:hypothetical protein V1290_006069 [Bradyrhizobium sp. AZCC 1578]|uniref:hypothetical protein n=1 Tax=Bradyrhizobium sp. AZCC 1578 TaxID=3117027 RepID=UPI002FF056C4